MFLSELRTEQKELFLDLAICLAKSDALYHEDEKKVIYEMCREMGITERTESRMELNVILEKISETAYTREKRIILLETVGIVLADGKYSVDEENMVKDILAKLDIEYVQYQELMKIIQRLYGIYAEIGKFLSTK